MEKNLFYQIALTMIPGIGPILSKKLIEHFGSPEAIFEENQSALLQIPGIGKTLSKAIKDAQVLHLAEKELDFIRKYKLKTYYYQDPSYPSRLKQCADSPLLLFQKGEADLNPTRTAAIVGTRKATPQGIQFCELITEGLVNANVQVISGLAFGIDIAAHRKVLEKAGQTVGVVAHGLNKIYPSAHRETARRMLANGAIVTELTSQAMPNAGNFPQRNRIVAGLADVTIVIESDSKGGSLITAEIANSYEREVMAVPGRPSDRYSTGCNQLIKQHFAHALTQTKDILQLMNWEAPKVSTPTSQLHFSSYTNNQQKVLQLLQNQGQLHFNQLLNLSQLTAPQLGATLIELELLQLIFIAPGPIYGLKGHQSVATT